MFASGTQALQERFKAGGPGTPGTPLAEGLELMKVCSWGAMRD